MGYLKSYALGFFRISSYIFDSLLLHFIYIFVDSYEDIFHGLYLHKPTTARKPEGIFSRIAHEIRE